MELDEMKLLWEDLSQRVEEQQHLTDQLILEMTQKKFHSKLRSISLPETIGSIVCFGFAGFLILNFDAMDTWYFVLSALISIALLVIPPVFSLLTIYHMQATNLAGKNVRQTIVTFSRLKKRFLLIQQLNIGLAFIFMTLCLPLSAKIFSDKDLFLNPNLSFGFIIGGGIFLYFFGRWGYKCYVNLANSAEGMLLELESEEEE